MAEAGREPRSDMGATVTRDGQDDTTGADGTEGSSQDRDTAGAALGSG